MGINHIGGGDDRKASPELSNYNNITAIICLSVNLYKAVWGLGFPLLFI
jgi:hypothetical protein